MFAAAASVLTSELTESVTFVDESESSQREVVTDSPGGIDFPSLQLTLHDHFSDHWPTTMRTACLRSVNFECIYKKGHHIVKSIRQREVQAQLRHCDVLFIGRVKFIFCSEPNSGKFESTSAK